MRNSALALAVVAASVAGGCRPRSASPPEAELRRLQHEMRVLDARRAQDPRRPWDGYPEQCRVHGTPLRGDVVPIVYGFLAIFTRPEWIEAHKTQFPFAQTWIAGGCTRYVPKRQHARYCPDCRAAEAKWMAEVFRPAMEQRYGPAATQAAARVKSSGTR